MRPMQFIIKLYSVIVADDERQIARTRAGGWRERGGGGQRAGVWDRLERGCHYGLKRVVIGEWERNYKTVSYFLDFDFIALNQIECS